MCPPELILLLGLILIASLNGGAKDDGCSSGCPPLTDEENTIFDDYIKDYYGKDNNAIDDG
jgi:hypothetical protein